MATIIFSPPIIKIVLSLAMVITAIGVTVWLIRDDIKKLKKMREQAERADRVWGKGDKEKETKNNWGAMISFPPNKHDIPPLVNSDIAADIVADIEVTNHRPLSFKIEPMTKKKKPRQKGENQKKDNHKKDNHNRHKGGGAR